MVMNAGVKKYMLRNSYHVVKMGLMCLQKALRRKTEGRHILNLACEGEKSKASYGDSQMLVELR